MAKNNAVQHLQCDLASNNIDIALIVETWFTLRIVDNAVAIRNYNLFRVDRTKHMGGGIAAYVREELHCKVIVPHTTAATLELMWLQIEFHGLLMFVLCCYHPPKPYYAAAEMQNAITCDLDILLTRRRL